MQNFTRCYAGSDEYLIKNLLWRGIIAEAVSEGPRGMYAVACCVRNRLAAGMDPGLCALKRKDLDRFVKREGFAAERTARAIVDKVFSGSAPDITLGATHYEAVKQYGVPAWAKGMRRAVTIGAHAFYRSKKSNTCVRDNPRCSFQVKKALQTSSGCFRQLGIIPRRL